MVRIDGDPERADALMSAVRRQQVRIHSFLLLVEGYQRRVQRSFPPYVFACDLSLRCRKLTADWRLIRGRKGSRATRIEGGLDVNFQGAPNPVHRLSKDVKPTLLTFLEKRAAPLPWPESCSEAWIACAAAIPAVEKTEAQASILMRPTTASDVEAVVGAGGRLPQKSTRFYPKMYSGLFRVSLWDAVD